MARSWDKNYYGSTEWQRKKEEYAENHERICCVCGCNDSTIDLHHLNYANFGGEEQESDLVYLCRDCHKRLHDAIDFVKSLVRGCYMNMSRDYEASRRAKFMEDAMDMYKDLCDEYEKKLEFYRECTNRMEQYVRNKKFFMNYYEELQYKNLNFIKNLTEFIAKNYQCEFESLNKKLVESVGKEKTSELLRHFTNDSKCTYSPESLYLKSGRFKKSGLNDITIGELFFIIRYCSYSDYIKSLIREFINKNFPGIESCIKDECVVQIFAFKSRVFLIDIDSFLIEKAGYKPGLPDEPKKPLNPSEMFIFQYGDKLYLTSEDVSAMTEEEKQSKEVECYEYKKDGKHNHIYSYPLKWILEDFV